MPLDADAVLAASARMIWVPPEAERVDTDEFTMVRYGNDFLHQTCVFAVQSDRPTSQVIAIVDEQTRTWGRDSVWWNAISEHTRPRSLEEALIARGGAVVERLAVLALDLTGPLPDLEIPDDAEVVLPTGVDHVRDIRAISEAAFGSTGSAAPDPQISLDRDVADREAGRAVRVVTYLDGVPAACGGTTFYPGGVAALWGGSTHPDQRGRGAYRATLDWRLRDAAARGARMALVKGRVDTSAPILRRAGFVEYGEERVYQLSVPAT
ncbi:hypothetical protein [Demetria terragena]|uniref:hypothetical protein n=1 Tax=Demetria terragena TaxID=63959 RepID=UPI00039BB2FF|nr:hypothetical protein [Demetria terragena]